MYVDKAQFALWVQSECGAELLYDAEPQCGTGEECCSSAGGSTESVIVTLSRSEKRKARDKERRKGRRERRRVFESSEPPCDLNKCALNKLM